MTFRPANAAALLGVALMLGALTAPALAVDLSGKTIRAEGTSIRADDSATDKTFTYPLEVYFGTGGNRFVKLGATTLDARILIPAGENRGSQRTKNGKWLDIATIQQSASAIKVIIESRGTPGYASEGWIFEIGVGSNACQVSKFRYNPDPDQYLSKSMSRAGNCTVSNGPPPGLADD